MQSTHFLSESSPQRPPDHVLKKVQLITDGACKGNPGPGGWACILRYGDKKKELYGSEPHTTNNRMEIMAAVQGLSALKESCHVVVITDSNYLKNGITTWIHGWKRNGWRTKEKKPVINQDLWQALDAEVQKHKTEWEWTKGHASHADNNRCDELATMAAVEQVSNVRNVRRAAPSDCNLADAAETS